MSSSIPEAVLAAVTAIHAAGGKTPTAIAPAAQLGRNRRSVAHAISGLRTADLWPFEEDPESKRYLPTREEIEAECERIRAENLGSGARHEIRVSSRMAQENQGICTFTRVIRRKAAY
jgi:hypothetical protein